ncbi:MAG: hypothetical protein NZU74_20010 [Chloroflexaceae bacterium]|nr:hypothetical protein [Chloroflexaceae bacterium]
MRRLNGQRPEQANPPINFDADDANKAIAIPHTEQLEVATTGEIANGKLGFDQKRLDFCMEA